MADDAVVRFLVVAAYAIVALVAGWVGRASRGRERHLWLTVAGALFLLGAAKELKIQGELTQSLRGVTRDAGLYASHRALQWAFVLLVALFFLFGAAALSRWLRPCRFTVKAAAASLAVLLIFLLIRTASIHSIDVWTIAQFGGIRRGWWLEMLILACIAGCAAIHQTGTARGSVSTPL